MKPFTPCNRQAFTDVEVRENFIRFMEQLGVAGFRIDPNECPCGRLHVIQENTTSPSGFAHRRPQ